MAILTLQYWLRHYYKLQDKILLCYRPSEKHGWADRAFYLSEEYDPLKGYNHRNILQNEVVIEFDKENPDDNRKYADEVCKRLAKDGLSYSKWSSGNKSVHVHVLFNFESCRNISLMKNTLMRHYSKDLPDPDMRLAVDNHLIRAENGIHEKTGRFKTLLYKTKDYPRVNLIPERIWSEYGDAMRTVMKRRLSTDINELVEHPGFKWILTAEDFREVNDGRERALFMLIHVLKPKYEGKKDELIEYLQDWYRYSGGTKLSKGQIKSKVNYHWEKSYTFSNKYINELLSDLGKKELIQ